VKFLAYLLKDKLARLAETDRGLSKGIRMRKTLNFAKCAPLRPKGGKLIHIMELLERQSHYVKV
jgi:hypothetical protein